jgi:FkbM family methyltransferase
MINRSISVANSLKLKLYKFYINMEEWWPFSRGYFIMGRLLNSIFGLAKVPFRGFVILAGPLARIERSIINNNMHDGFVDAALLDAVSRRRGIVIDIGANIGLFSLTAAAAGASMTYAFEPSRRELCSFYQNLILNKQTSVVVFPCALGADSHTSELHESDIDNPGMNSLVDLSQVRRYISNSSVAVCRLDSLLPAETLLNVDFVKIDVEGYEYRVLLGMEAAIEYLRGAIFVIEITRSYLVKIGDTPEDIFNFMKRYGFVEIGRSRYGDDNQYDVAWRYVGAS